MMPVEGTKLRFGGVSAAVVMTAACAGPIVGAEDCSTTFASHGGTDVPEALGNGVIVARGGYSYGPYGNGERGFSESYYEFRDCGSGEDLNITFSFEDYDEDGRLVDSMEYDEGRFSSFTSQFKDLGEAVSLSALSELGMRHGFLVAGSAESSGYETCGCRALYPGSRGSKKPYEVPA